MDGAIANSGASEYSSVRIVTSAVDPGLEQREIPIQEVDLRTGLSQTAVKKCWAILPGGESTLTDPAIESYNIADLCFYATYEPLQLEISAIAILELRCRDAEALPFGLFIRNSVCNIVACSILRTRRS